MYVRNCWYVAARHCEIKEDVLFSCMIINRPLVIYRKTDGSLAAFENRCCHRGAPLSMGRREGDDLRCLYHGLKFAPDGRCIEIPGQEKVPAKACVKTFPVVEAHSWIWV
jgi:vanillate O-demethylase monooxygenase subunit